MIFGDKDFARRTQNVVAQGSCDFVDSIHRNFPELEPDKMEVTGGWATFDGGGYIQSTVQGWGLDGDISDDELDCTQKFFAGHDAIMKVEIVPADDYSLVNRLIDRGFHVRQVLNLAAQELHEDLLEEPESHIDISVASADEAELWARTNQLGFMGKDEAELDPVLNKLVISMFHIDSMIPMLARINGEIAGAAMMDIRGDIAYFVSASTIPRFRKQGVQSSFYRARRRYAWDHGAKIVTVIASMGLQSLHNAVRQGLHPQYTILGMSRESLEGTFL